MKGPKEPIFLDSPVQFDTYRPRYHLQPHAGWLNDPNGPVYYKGRYHLFYQHLPEACEWDFGIVWGHSVSEDLLNWRPLPPALVPTPGGLDADGCFSGCCIIDPVSGLPTILYTGVRLRSNVASGPPPPPEHDLGLVWIESQMVAVPEDPEDELLVRWTKRAQAMLEVPPADYQLTGWRDPFIYYANTLTPTANDWRTMEHRMLIGSGIKGQGGTALVYTSNRVESGWKLRGTLCSGVASETGFVWECPLIVPLVTDASTDETADAASHIPGGPGLVAIPGPPHWLVGSSSIPPPELAPLNAHGDANSGRPLGSHRHRLARNSVDSDGATSEVSREDSFEFSAVGDGGSVAMLSDLSPSVELWPSPRLPHAESEAEDEATSTQLVHSDNKDADNSNDVVSELHARIGSRNAMQPIDIKPSAFETAQQKKEKRDSRETSPRRQSLSMNRAVTLEPWAKLGTSPFDTKATTVVNERTTNERGSALTSTEDLGKAFIPPTSEVPETTTRSPVLSTQPPDTTRVSSPERDRPPPPLPPPSPTGPADSRGRVLGLNLPAQSRRDPSIDQFAQFQQRVFSIRPRRTASVEQRMGRLRGAGTSEAALLDNSRSVSRDPGPRRQWHLFSVSPDAPTNPVLFWVGHVSPDGMQFEIEHAKGPFRLDLGDVLYAPNVLQDAHGRWLLWGWIQEKRGVGSYDYAGCITLPRELRATPDGRLIQAPIAEVTRLRRGDPGMRLHNTALAPSKSLPLDGVHGDCLDIVITLQRGRAYAAGLLFQSYEAGDENGAALIYDWVTGRLEVVYGVPQNWTEAWLPQISTAVTPASTEATTEQAGPGWNEEQYVDPAMLLVTPRFSSQVSTPLASMAGAVGGLFSPESGRLSTSFSHAARDVLWPPSYEASATSSPTILPLHPQHPGHPVFGGLVHAPTAPSGALRAVESVASGITHLGGGIRRSSTYLRLGAPEEGNGPPEFVDEEADDLALEEVLGGTGLHPDEAAHRASSFSQSRAPHNDEPTHRTLRGRGLTRHSVDTAALRAAGRAAVGAVESAGLAVGSLPLRTGGLVARGLFGRSKSRDTSSARTERPEQQSTLGGPGTTSERQAGPPRPNVEPFSPESTSTAPTTTVLGSISRPLSRTPSFLAPATPANAGETLEQLLEDLAGTAPEGAAAPAPPPEMRRVGGPLAMRPNDTLHLRILLDHSCLEVFTGTGEALSARIYRGSPPPGSGTGIELVAFGDGPAQLRLLEAWELFGIENVHTASVPLSPVVSPRGQAEAGVATGPATPGAAAREALFDQLVSGLGNLDVEDRSKKSNVSDANNNNNF